jgi:spermidine synthase
MIQSTSGKQLQRGTLLAALFCTAFSSLVYELIWSRELSYVFGSTALAVSSVLAVFMGGLALGSLYGGKILEARKKPFQFLALLQFAVGVSCILTLSAIKGISSLQSCSFELMSGQTFWIRTALFMLTSCVLIVPTFLIGVAFPYTVQLYHAKHNLVGESVSRCYWVDTLGASLGMLLAAFFLVSRFGFLRTSVTGSILNLLTGILIFAVLRETDANAAPTFRTSAPSEQQNHNKLKAKVVFFLFFLSGFSALVLEVIWIRHWILVYGSGLHAFAIVVVTFLLGLSLGSLFYSRFLKKVQNQIFLFCLIELSLGATAAIITALFPYAESAFMKIYYAMDNYQAFIIIMGLICFFILLIPTMLMGITLPTLCAINVSEYHIGRDFGKLYAANSFGALAGSFCAGFIIIPALGIYNSSFLAGGIYVFIAFAFLFGFSEPGVSRRKASTIFIVILMLTAAVFSVLYKPNYLYSGVFYTGTTYKEEDYQLFVERQKKAKQFLRYIRDGVYGQVTVTGPADGLLLRTNGRIDSGTTGDLVSYQSLLGHVPMVIHKKPFDILNIGLGCGWTVRAAAAHPLLKSIDCVEINPLIVEVNKNVFHSYNNDIVNNPKLNIIINDGRNYVAHTKKSYDAVVSEPTDLSSSGISALFTTEFYKSVHNILNEDGILCQWFPRYEVVEKDYKIIINTIKHIFPYAYEFDMSKITGEGYYKSFLIVASKEPIDINERLQQRKIQQQDGPEGYRSYLQGLVGIVERSFSRDNTALETYIADVNELNTDDLPVLEFHALKTRFRKFRGE